MSGDRIAGAHLPVGAGVRVRLRGMRPGSHARRGDGEVCVRALHEGKRSASPAKRGRRSLADNSAKRMAATNFLAVETMTVYATLSCAGRNELPASAG